VIEKKRHLVIAKIFISAEDAKCIPIDRVQTS
jgi:hypothetical protein